MGHANTNKKVKEVAIRRRLRHLINAVSILMPYMSSVQRKKAAKEILEAKKNLGE